MRIAAITAIRNEEHFIGRKIKHLINQNIDVYILDNESTDKSVSICLDLGIPQDQIIHIPFDGTFTLSQQLHKKQELRARLSHDWFIHTDADEIITTYNQEKSLRSVITEADEQGFNVLNCDEFVFIPEDEVVNYKGSDYVSSMKYYYFYEPQPYRLMRIYRNDVTATNIDTGGHGFPQREIRLFPHSLVLKHYIGLNMAFIRKKYRHRIYNPEELGKNWHRSRIIDWDQVTAPEKESLQYLSGNKLDKSQPKSQHFWFWSKGETS